MGPGPRPGLAPLQHQPREQVLAAKRSRCYHFDINLNTEVFTQMALGATVPVVIRLTQADLRLLDTLAERLHSARPGTVALALRHMASTMDQGNPVYLDGPGAGLAAITTPSSAMGKMLAGNAARVQARVKERNRTINRAR